MKKYCPIINNKCLGKQCVFCDEVYDETCDDSKFRLVCNYSNHECKIEVSE